MSSPAPIQLRDVIIDPPLALAPMVGLSHSALRGLLVEIGGVGLFFTEMLSARRLPQDNESVSPSLIATTAENPLFYQIFLHEPSLIIPAVEKLHRIGAQGIDINLGCPAPRLRKRGAGCALTKNPASVRKIIATLRKSTSLPLSAKIRLGDTLDEKQYLDLCTIIEDEGVDCLSIHARLNYEKFCRKPRWSWIAKAKKRVTIPIFANGGIFTVEDAEECLNISGADGLMIGRGAAVRPWIFAEINAAIYNGHYTPVKLCDIYRKFSELLTERFSKERQLGRLKQFTHYFAESYLYGHQLASAVQNSTSMNQAVERAEAFFGTHEQLSSS